MRVRGIFAALLCVFAVQPAAAADLSDNVDRALSFLCGRFAFEDSSWNEIGAAAQAAGYRDWGVHYQLSGSWGKIFLLPPTDQKTCTVDVNAPDARASVKAVAASFVASLPVAMQLISEDKPSFDGSIRTVWKGSHHTVTFIVGPAGKPQDVAVTLDGR